jgi:Mrp family chromosome partitioning ATPase/predicted Fe-Mo cluster-binding NifX family protein
MSEHGHSCKHNKKDDQDLAIQQALDRIKHKLLILSGKGGVGKSTVAVNLAVALSKTGAKVGLLDVDIHGPSVPRLLGLQENKPVVTAGRINPVCYNENLKVVSIENFLDMSDTPVIWRGPMKITAIRQFLADVAWEELDYLVIDSPPGTGDEPLSVVQTIPNTKAIIVTTPQEISLADVRKSINFCRSVELPILGLVENMSGYVCPECGHHRDLFGSGGGEKTAARAKLDFLGKIPVDPNTVQAGDSGKPNLSDQEESPAAIAFKSIVEMVAATCQKTESGASPASVNAERNNTAMKHNGTDKTIAVPTANGMLSPHFGHCEHFLLFDIQDSKITGVRTVDPPAHEPGVLPRWLHEQGANVIIAGGMGQRAQQFFIDFGIQVVIGAPTLTSQMVVEQYLSGKLETGDNLCDH